MILIFLTLALSLTPPDSTPLTFVHGDEQIVTWLDRGAMRRTGDRVRMRVLRIRHSDQAFWVVKEIDCAARTWALVGDTVTATDDPPPPLDGEAMHMQIARDDHAENATLDAVCNGVFVQAGVAPARGAVAAIARLEETRAAAVRTRPLQLIIVAGGASPLFMDRATLESGGPQVEVRSLKMTGRGGVWSGWMLDCERRDLAVDLQWTAGLMDGGYGVVTRDWNSGGAATTDPQLLALVATACDPGVWDMRAHASIEAAMRAAGANRR